MGKNRVTIKNDINIEKDSSPFGRFKSIGSTIGGWGKKGTGATGSIIKNGVQKKYNLWLILQTDNRTEKK